MADTRTGADTVAQQVRRRKSPRSVAGSRPAPVRDYHQWSLDQAAHLRAGRFDRVDAVNVADEIEDVGKSEKRELRSNLEAILVHMLKWDLQPDRRSRSWSLSIAEHRRRVVRNLADSPSLASRLKDLIDEAYDIARLRAARETDLPLGRFSSACAYDPDEVLTAPYGSDED